MNILIGVLVFLVAFVLVFAAWGYWAYSKYKQGVGKPIAEQYEYFHPFHVFLTILRYFIAAPLVVFFSTADKLSLRICKCICTIDWPLTGDPGWREKHLWGSDPFAWYNRTRWLFRNGFNDLNYNMLGVPDDPKWRSEQPEGTISGTRPDGAWVKRSFTPLPFGRFLEKFEGWAIFGPQQGRCKFVSTIRIRTTTN